MPKGPECMGRGPFPVWQKRQNSKKCPGAAPAQARSCRRNGEQEKTSFPTASQFTCLSWLNVCRICVVSTSWVTLLIFLHQVYMCLQGYIQNPTSCGSVDVCRTFNCFATRKMLTKLTVQFLGSIGKQFARRMELSKNGIHRIGIISVLRHGQTAIVEVCKGNNGNFIHSRTAQNQSAQSHVDPSFFHMQVLPNKWKTRFSTQDHRKIANAALRMEARSHAAIQAKARSHATVLAPRQDGA